MPSSESPDRSRRGDWHSIRIVLPVTVLLLLYAANLGAVRVVSGDDGARFFGLYPVYFGLVFLVYLAAVRATWRSGLRTGLAVIALGVAFRLLVVPTPVVLSSDVFRYLWDGRVQVAGINPYLHAPAAEALAPLRDSAIFPSINRPGVRTVYPPGAQAAFAALAWLAPDSLVAWRLFLILCELATMFLLVALLRQLGLPEGRVAAYAFAPLAVFEIAQAGHVEGLMVPLVLAALLARMGGRSALAGTSLGGAALVKLYPAILVPILWQRGDRRFPLAFVATVALGYLSYAATAGSDVIGFLPLYFSRFEDFNIGLRTLLTDGIGLQGRVPRAVAVGAFTLALALAVALIARRRPDTPRGLAHGAGAAVGAYLLLLPTALHPWYAVWLVPFLPFLGSGAWWYLTAAVALSYTGYLVDPSQVSAWVRAVEFGPVYGLVLLHLCDGRRLASMPAARKGNGWWSGSRIRSSRCTWSR